MVDGEEIKKFESIAKEAQDFFRKLYTREAGGRPRIKNLFESKIFK